VLLDDQPRGRGGKGLIFIGVGLLIASISATLSATVTINTDNRVEFGQGIKYIDACDDWVEIIPRTGAGVENDYVKYIDIKGLDTTRCKSVNIEISMFSTGSASALSTYSLPLTPTTCAEATGGTSASPGTQQSSKACDGITNDATNKYLRQLFSAETAVVNMTFSENQEIRALDFFGGGDDGTYDGRRVWKTELLRCDSSSFSSCSNLGLKTYSWTGYSSSTNNARYPERAFWLYDQHSKSQYFQVKLSPWSKFTGSADAACTTHCVQIAEMVPLVSKDKLTLYVDSARRVYINKSNSTTPLEGDVIRVSNNSERLDLDYSSSTGTYTVALQFPIALASAVNTITIQTASASDLPPSM